MCARRSCASQTTSTSALCALGLWLFFFILCCNLLGLIPYGSTATGNVSVTATLAIITAIAPAHTEFFPDESAIADAKGEIFQGLQPGGTASGMGRVNALLSPP